MEGNTPAEVESVELKVGFYMLVVQDVERALRFYRDVLGMDQQGLDDNNDTPEWARLTLGDAIIVLRRNNYDTSDEIQTGTAIYLVREGSVDGLTWSGLHFEAYDIPSLCLRVEEAGGRTLNPPRRARDGTIVADLADPEGNVFIFYSPPG